MSQIKESVTFKFFARLTKYMDDLTILVMGIFEWNAVILMVLISAEVVMRYLFQRPTIWSGDLQIYISAGGRVIGIGYATMVHSQITMDLFTNKLSFRPAKALELINYIIFHIPLLVALSWVTLSRGLLALKTGELFYSGTWRPPLSPIILFIVGGYVLLTLQVFAECIKCVIHLQKNSNAWLRQR